MRQLLELFLDFSLGGLLPVSPQSRAHLGAVAPVAQIAFYARPEALLGTLVIRQNHTSVSVNSRGNLIGMLRHVKPSAAPE